MVNRNRKRERGAALIEAAFTLPMLLLIAVGIFEFGRAYQFWQVLTNAAREAARYSTTPGAKVGDAEAIAVTYMKNGGLMACGAECVTVNRQVPFAIGNGTSVTINYPFQFIVLQPVSKLVVKGNGIDNSLTMKATATMRNEGS